MFERIGTGIVLFVLALGLSGCERAPAAALIAPPPPPPPPLTQAFFVADVTVTGVVFELTSAGRVPLEGVSVANGEGWGGLTDANGSFSFRPVWVCPCAAQPWVPANTTFLWIEKNGFQHPPGQPPSVFGGFYASSGARDVMIDGDTHIEIQLVRR